eukprot:scaffold50217_cov466-Isochrysis_galbana.AAC.1
MSNVDWCARRAKAQSRLSLKDGVILGRGLSVNEFSSSVVGAGEVMLTGTICFVQMGVVVSAIGVGGCCDSRRGLCCTHFPCLEPKLWPVVRRQASSAGQSQEVPQAVARARNHTWVELLSVLSAGTRLELLSA